MKPVMARSPRREKMIWAPGTITETPGLELMLKELKKEHAAVCNQRDELNNLLGKMMYKNVRLKMMENSLKNENKKLIRKLQKKKLI